MRVLAVTVVHDPEDARIRHRQIEALLAAGHQVVLAAPFRAYGRPLPDRFPGVDLPRARSRRRLAAVLAARRVIRRHGRAADVVLLHDPELLLAAALLPGVRRVWDVHEDTAAAVAMREWLPRPTRRAAARAVRAAEHLAERHIPLLLAEPAYAQRFSRPHPVVPNTVLLPPAVPPPGSDRVVYVGRLTRPRGALDLVELGRLLRPYGIAVELIGNADGDCRAQVAAAATRRDVRWHGFVPNARALPLLDGALAGLSLLHDQANYARSHPTKLFEYMARGLPVVTTPNPASVEIVTRHGCGVTVPFGDPAAAAEAVLALRADPRRRVRLGAAGRAAATAHYSWAVDGPAFVAALEALARPGRRPAR